MKNLTKSELAAENASLRTRLAELAAALAKRSARTGAPPGSGSFRRAAVGAAGQDATERQPIGDATLASELRYRRLFETAKDGILILDAETGLITDANPFLESLLGYAREELLGKALWEIGPFKDIAASRDAFRQLLEKEYIRYENLPLETKGREQKQVEFISNVYKENGDRVVQCNIRDITDRRQAEERLQKVNDDLSVLVAELQRHDHDLILLNRMQDLLQSCSSREEAYRVIALMAGELFDGQPGCLARLRAEDQYLETVARWGDETVVEPLFASEDCWAMRRGQPHEVLEPQTGLLCRHFVHQPETGYVCVPLTVQGETMGVLCLIGALARSGKHQINRQRLALMLGETIKLSLSNLQLREELREQAVRDPLTGLFNRRYLEDILARELHRAQRGKTPLCAAILDLDHFKRFNDTFGHEAGDSLLREIGRVLREHLRMSDISCRYGGEEFVLILPDSSLEDTRQRIEEIRVLVSKLQLRDGQKLLGRMTVSAGIAEATKHGFAARDLLRAADDTLYAAKAAGRDRVVVEQATE